MSYAEKFIKSKGQDCIIERPVPIHTKVSIKRSTSGTRDVGIRAAYWQGLIPVKYNLLSGEYLSIKGKKYLVQTADLDHASKECAFYCAKCNCIINHQREIESGVDEWNQIIVEWQNVNSDLVNIPSYCEIVTYRMRQEDVGLLDNTKYTFQLPKTMDVQLLDRIVYNDEKLRVESINDTGLEGVLIIQVTDDVRP